MQIIGHRGARQEAPENTLGGFKHIKQIGLRATEFDVRLTQDQQLVVIHDASVNRTANVMIDRLVSQMTVAELIHYDHRAAFPTWQASEPTPLLKDVLNICQDFEHIEVEVKSVDSQLAAITLCHILDQALQDYAAQVTITSFDLKILTALQQMNSTLKRGLLFEATSVIPENTKSSTEHFEVQIVQLATSLGCCRVGMADTLMTQSLFEALCQNDLLCSVWTVNDIARAKTLASWGVDGLITDVPSRMIAAGVGTLQR